MAAAVRLWRLDSVPPGFTHDEAGHGHDAVAILHGARPIYEMVGYGREPLYDYLVAGLMALAGPTGRVLRFSAVPLGLLTLLFTFLWVRLAFDRSTALVATVLQGASFWSLSTGRQALRSGLLPALFVAAVLAFWRAVYDDTGSDVRCGPPGGRRKWARAAAYGTFALLVGAMLYTYIPARGLWVVFVAFLGYLALVQRTTFRHVWRPVSVALLIGLLLAVPLFAYLRTHPGAEQRLDMLSAPLRAVQAGDVSVILDRVWRCLAGLFVPGRGDDFLAYTIPGRAVFDPLGGLLFLAGLALCVARWRKPANAFAVIWLLAGIAPSLITGATASTTRSIAALPVVFLFPALALVAGVRWVGKRLGQWPARVVGLVAVAWIAATAAISARDYFVVWGESPDVRAAYQHTLVEIAAYLDDRPPEGLVGLSTVYPHAPHDPYVLAMGLSREDLALRWFDAGRALVLPQASTARLVVPSAVPLDPYFAGLPGIDLRERVLMREDDLDPFFAVYDWHPAVSVDDLRQRARGRPRDLALPVEFGDALQLIGYDLVTPEIEPGGTIELVTLWQVVDPEPLRPRDLSRADEDLVFFTHALDGSGAIAGQEDRLDAPAWDWQAGDVIAQIHCFAVLPDLSPGPLLLDVGVYRRVDLVRLPILVNGSAVGDHVTLQAVEVVQR